LAALLLGLLEGLTEFIPVSSTGHLLLGGRLLGFASSGHTFEVMIQLGAVLAVLSVYAARLRDVAVRLPTDPAARRFTLGVFLAFLPAAAIGAFAHGWIKGVLYEAPALICINLILGGIALLALDRWPRTVRHAEADALPAPTALMIGLFQCLALMPGVSRSGATVAGALLLGVGKRAAAEFSFFLAMPTMAGAFGYELISNLDTLRAEDAWLIAIGFVAAFISALLVVRRLLEFVARRGFAPFAYWRIAVGILGLGALEILQT
jgi:undecaprenyl-diphosphatase